MKFNVLSIRGSSRRGGFEQNFCLIKSFRFQFFDVILFDDIDKDHYYDSEYSESEISCAYSHQAILKQFLQSNDEICWVLEDDVEPVADEYQNKISLVEKFLNQHTSPAVVFLGGMRDVNSFKYFVSEKHEFKSLLLHKSFNSDEYLFRTCCYALNRSAAREIILRNSPVSMPADKWSFFNAAKNIDYYIVNRDIFVHPPIVSGSTVDHTRVRHNGPLRYLMVMKRIVRYLYLKSILLVRF